MALGTLALGVLVQLDYETSIVLPGGGDKGCARATAGYYTSAPIIGVMGKQEMFVGRT
jgi:hypothetical protein